MTKKEYLTSAIKIMVEALSTENEEGLVELLNQGLDLFDPKTASADVELI